MKALATSVGPRPSAFILRTGRLGRRQSQRGGCYAAATVSRFSVRAGNTVLTEGTLACARNWVDREGTHDETAEEQGGVAGRAYYTDGGLHRAGATECAGADQRTREDEGATSVVAKTTGPEASRGDLALGCWTCRRELAVNAPS